MLSKNPVLCRFYNVLPSPRQELLAVPVDRENCGRRETAPLANSRLQPLACLGTPVPPCSTNPQTNRPPVRFSPVPSVRQFRQAATTCLPDDPSSPIKLAEPDDRPGHTPSPAPCRPPRRVPHPGRGPYRLPGRWGPGLVLPTGRSPFPSHQPTCMLVSRGAVCEVRFLPDGGVAACRLSR